ncbi:MAG TPA: tRNA 2-thiouridine(34) synthase MnmA [Thermodesulfobacteriota bacterium]
MATRARIAVAMSGGVDSSVAAARLVAEGHEVIGLSMRLYTPPGETSRCCSADDLGDARRVADHLGFRHYVLNYEDAFREAVVVPFVREYLAGRTPIPCVACNSHLKFDRMLALARGLGATALATGHYARVEGDGPYRLLKGRDPARDQSYYLYPLGQDALRYARFPLGDMTKAEVRAEAARLGLPVAHKPDSQEICFVPDGDHAAFVERAAGAEAPRPGAVVDLEGREIGRHGGVHRFTVGQRRGLGPLAGPPGTRRFVVDIDAAAARVTVGPRPALLRAGCEIAPVHWVSGEPPAGPLRAVVKIRARHPGAPALVTPTPEGGAVVRFDEPQAGVAPGQAGVFYDGDVVLGGGVIRAATR